MKAQITISGQISGNFAIARALPCYSENVTRGMFNSFIIVFDTVGEAKKALRSCCKSLKENQWNTLVSISKSNDFLSYDASKAILTKYEN